LSFLPVICSGVDFPDSIRQLLTDLNVPFLELLPSQLLTENTKYPLILIADLSSPKTFFHWENWKKERPEGFLLALVSPEQESKALEWLEKELINDFLLLPQVRLLNFKKALIQGSRGLASRTPHSSAHNPSQETPLQTVYHRIKNNLQVISSLLNLQVRRTQDLNTLQVLRETQNRILTMALAHEKLYQFPEQEKLNLAEYSQDLSEHLFHTYGLGLSNMDLSYDCESLILDVDTAISCGLILNELLTNAIKYAFPSTYAPSQSQIQIRLRILDGDLFEMSVADNGVGLPPQIQPLNPETLGLRLVNSLSRQLGGRIFVDTQGGTRISILFPYNSEQAS
jgi:two-component sensor histidine kinase